MRIEDDYLNMPSGGVITSQYSDSPEGSDISKIADDNIKTRFITNHSSFYIIWSADNSYPINRYSLTSASDAPDKDPASWTLSGLDDYDTWILLDQQENQVFSQRGEKKEYSFDNKTEYQYYALEILSNAGNESTQIAEWTLEIEGIDDLLKFSTGDSYSIQTPMGRFFERRHVTTEEDRIWLKDAKQDAPLPKREDRNLRAFTVRLYPSGSPKFTDVNQRGIGNCAALAVFTALAYSYPEFIKSIIKDNGDQTFTVSMFDPQGKPVEVSVNSKFLVEMHGDLLGARGRNNTSNWSTVLEKAIMKYNYIYKINPNYDISGIGFEHVLPLFTGNGDSFGYSHFTLSPKNLARVVNTCLKKGKLVFGGFDKANLPVDGSKTITAHAYTFMLSPNKDALFLMRNPWGSNPNFDDHRHGVLRIPNDLIIAPTIIVRIIEPGLAGKTECTVPGAIATDEPIITRGRTFNFFGNNDRMAELMRFADGDSHSYVTPMGRFHQSRHVTTDDDRIWLNDATLDAPFKSNDNRQLIHFPVNLYPSGKPTVSDVNLRKIANSHVTAVLASMVYSYPEFVKSLIKDNGDNTYTVSLFDPQGKPVKVSVNTKFLCTPEGELLSVRGKDDGPNWTTVLEKALMKYNHIYKINGNYDLSWIGTEHVSPIFTGNGDSFGFAPNTLSPEDFAEVVNTCLKDGKFVVGYFNTHELPVDGSNTIPNHAYTFMLSQDEDALFLMRNPWGYNPHVGDSMDGILRIPNDTIIVPTIDLRIIEPGIAAKTELVVPGEIVNQTDRSE